MIDKKIIAFDLDGGDNGPLIALNAAKKFLLNNKDWKILGFTTKLDNKYFLLEDLPKNLTLIRSKTNINQDDSALAVVRKTNSSLIMAIDSVKKQKASVVLSATASGPLVFSGYYNFKTISKSVKPAFAPLATNVFGNLITMLDVGANIDTTPATINYYATMGSELIKALEAEIKPGVKLLNIGSEPEKGNKLLKESFNLLKNNEKINFLGNIEGNMILADKSVSVIVTDSVNGNIALKTLEGTIEVIVNIIKDAVTTSFTSKLGFALAKKFRVNFKKIVNEDYLGGAVILGLNELIIKAHGRSNEKMLFNALVTAQKLINSNLIDKIKKV